MHFKNPLRLVSILGLLATLCVMGPHAQAEDRYEANNIQLFYPTTGGYSWFSRDYAQVGDHLQPYGGMTLRYARAPLVAFINNERFEIVSHQLSLDVVASLSLFKWVEIGVGIPTVPLQRGLGLSVVPQVSQFDAGRASMGDIRLSIKVPFYHSKHVHLGAAAMILLPSGDRGNFTGEQTASGVVPKLLSHFTFLNNRLIWSLDAGLRFRKEAQLANINFTHELTFGTSLAYEILKERLYAGIDLYGASGFRFATWQETPIEGLLGLKVRVSSFVFSLGGGAGFTSGYGASQFQFVGGVAFFPRPRIKIVEKIVEKEKIVEQRIVEKVLVKEPSPAAECPEPIVQAPPPKVVVTRKKIRISDKVYFEFDSDKIHPVSFPLLDKVAEAIVGAPRLQQILIEGHTDNKGSDKYNLDLSNRRARSIMNYLVSKGVETARLTSKGFGFRKPKFPNTTERGRALNRRVEFTIMKQEEDPNAPEDSDVKIEEDFEDSKAMSGAPIEESPNRAPRKKAR